MVGSYSTLRNRPFQYHGRRSILIEELYNARSNLESELCNIRKDNTDAIDRQDRRVKVERLVFKLMEVFSKLVQKKNEELFDFASKAENPDSIYHVLEQWLDDETKTNDKFLLAARSYIDSVADIDTVCEGVNPQWQSKRSSRRTSSSMYRQLFHGKTKTRRTCETRTSCNAPIETKTRNYHEKKAAWNTHAADGTSRIGGRPSPASCRS